MDLLQASFNEIHQIAETHQGVACFGSLKGSPTERAGMLRGDIITEVNGKRVTSIEEWLDARSRDDTKLDVRFIRYQGGVPVEMETTITIGGFKPTMEEIPKLIPKIVDTTSRPIGKA